MKKLKLFIVALASVLLLSGCSGNYIQLTESESDAIAQYCAYLLLKYDNNKNFSEKLLDARELKDAKEDLAKAEERARYEAERREQIFAGQTSDGSEEKEETEDTSSEEVSPTPEIESDKMKDQSPEDTSGDGRTHGTSATEDASKDNNIESLSELYDPALFEVRYDTFEVCDSYKSDYDYFDITAPEGKQLIVLTFTISNVTSDIQKFSSADHKIKYQLVINGKSISPAISLIPNDIQFLDEELKASDEMQTVLMFITDPVQEEKIYLQALGGFDESPNEKAYVINLQ